MTIDFILTIPTAFLFATATFEAGFLSLRDVMLERAVDVAVREVRTGQMVEVNHDNITKSICDNARIIPNCLKEVRLEMIRNNVRDFTFIDPEPDCVDREDESEAKLNFTPGGNNELMILRACVLFDPMLPAAKLGATIPKKSAGAYALVATSSFVVEPHQ